MFSPVEHTMKWKGCRAPIKEHAFRRLHDEKFKKNNDNHCGRAARVSHDHFLRLLFLCQQTIGAVRPIIVISAIRPIRPIRPISAIRDCAKER
jgi:hypothetical protein